MSIPNASPSKFNLLAICEAAVAACTLPAAYSESTYVDTITLMLYTVRENKLLTFSEYAIAAIPKHIQQNKKLMIENAK